MRVLKQVVASLCALAVAVGIFTGVVLYTLQVIREYEARILLGTDDRYTVVQSK